MSKLKTHQRETEPNSSTVKREAGERNIIIVLTNSQTRTTLRQQGSSSATEDDEYVEDQRKHGIGSANPTVSCETGE